MIKRKSLKTLIGKTITDVVLVRDVYELRAGDEVIAVLLPGDSLIFDDDENYFVELR